MITKKRFRSLLAWIILAIYWPTLFIGTHLPRLPEMPFHPSDKALHFCAYLMLTLLFWLARFGGRKPRLREARIYKVILLFSLYGILDEVTQTFVGRHGDVADWVADFCGSLSALALLIVFRRWWHWLLMYAAFFFLLCHWPGRERPFDKLPLFFQRFGAIYIMLGHCILTLLWWRANCPQPRFMFTRQILLTTLLVLPSYVLADELVSRLMNRDFNFMDLVGALVGIAVGIMGAWMLARHHLRDESEVDRVEATERAR